LRRETLHSWHTIERAENVTVVRLSSSDDTNRITRSLVSDLTSVVRQLGAEPNPKPLIITGNDRFFSAGADLREIAALVAAEALNFAHAGQELMNSVAQFPAPTCAAIFGYCMGGGLDLALACGHRIAAPNAVFGHRGAALGLMTGWGGTQRLPRLVGKGRALQMFLAAEKVNAREALASWLVERISDDPLGAAVTLLTASKG
jgi:enoyl-CoA hydratase/carnithine racemase